jgi:hypothetical protein
MPSHPTQGGGVSPEEAASWLSYLVGDRILVEVDPSSDMWGQIRSESETGQKQQTSFLIMV